MNRTIGTCSNCGGRVVVPTVYMSVVPPVPHCEKCGAQVAQPHGGVIEMKPPPAPKRGITVSAPEVLPGDVASLFPRDVR